jgi:selenocysteine lyase/cysteine desulfurase
MSPGARAAHLDFARLAADEGGSLFFDRFLRHGTGDWPAAARDQYPGLAGWRGVAALKESLRMLAGSRPDLPVLLAARSAQLMQLAARLLVRPCRNVLTTDLSWPAYEEILLAQCRRANQRVTRVPVLDMLLRGRATEDDVVEFIRAEFVRNGCDGLFLTAVSNLGLRLPVERIVRAVETAGRTWFVVIDGAQDFCHVSADIASEYCDLYLTGSHKWLGAYHPMGLGYYGRRRSRSFIETVLAECLREGEIDDPLLRFSTQLEAGSPGETETVSLASLFACQGAVADAVAGGCDSLPRRLANALALGAAAVQAGWRPLLPQPAFRTGIFLLQAERQEKREVAAEDIRSAFFERGVALTAYEAGIVRLSMPVNAWRPGEVEHLAAVLRAVA